MEERWYCASYHLVDSEGNVMTDSCPDPDFFSCENDDVAVEMAYELALKGVDYADEGHFGLDLLEVTRVDPNNDWKEVETIWY